MMPGESQEAPRGNNGGETASHVALYRHRVENESLRVNPQKDPEFIDEFL